MEATRRCNLDRQPTSYVDGLQRWIVQGVDSVEGHNQCVLLHPNGLAIVCLAEEHPAVRAAKEGKKLDVDFRVGRQSKADVVPTGKSKTGAVGLQVRSGLCKISIEDHLKKGYIAIIETRTKDWESSVTEMGMVMEHKGDPRYV